MKRPLPCASPIFGPHESRALTGGSTTGRSPSHAVDDLIAQAEKTRTAVIPFRRRHHVRLLTGLGQAVSGRRSAVGAVATSRQQWRVLAGAGVRSAAKVRRRGLLE